MRVRAVSRPRLLGGGIEIGPEYDVVMMEISRSGKLVYTLLPVDPPLTTARLSIGLPEDFEVVDDRLGPNWTARVDLHSAPSRLVVAPDPLQHPAIHWIWADDNHPTREGEIVWMAIVVEQEFDRIRCGPFVPRPDLFEQMRLWHEDHFFARPTPGDPGAPYLAAIQAWLDAQPMAEIKVKLVTRDGPLQRRPILFFPGPRSGCWVSDPVVAVAYPHRPGMVFARALSRRHPPARKMDVSEPEPLDGWRGRILGWADRPGTGFRGTHTPDVIIEAD